ncbi:MAG: TraL conjugative transposon family protein [Dysgonamonadaceae bacterium]|nr:TraL conjugative transposon family protein [Dysgonamonadaceae bacterium]
MREKLITQLGHIWDELTCGIRWLCLCPSPCKRLITALVLIAVFGGINIYFVANSIYNMGKRDAEKKFLELQHIQPLELQYSKDSINSIKNHELKIKNKNEYE